MKKHTLIVIVCIILIFSDASCGQVDENISKAEPNKLHTLPYPSDYDTTSEGGSSYNGENNHFDSPYFAHPHIYNMQSNENLTILSNFKTYQQTTEYSCGASSAVMVMNYFGISDYDELTIAERSGTHHTQGVSPKGLSKFFNEIGWNIQTSADNGDLYTPTFDDFESFSQWVQNHLKNDTPIMVGWQDWGGHWQVIIGYDTMGTKHLEDDVIITADPYDTTDQYQDGYMIYGAERFLNMRSVSPEVSGDQHTWIQPWVIATPKSN